MSRDGDERLIEADTAVVAAGGRPDKALYEELKRGGAEVYCAGDCVEPRGIAEAISDGSRVGLQI